MLVKIPASTPRHSSCTL